MLMTRNNLVGRLNHAYLCSIITEQSSYITIKKTISTMKHIDDFTAFMFGWVLVVALGGQLYQEITQHTNVGVLVIYVICLVVMLPFAIWATINFFKK